VTPHDGKPPAGNTVRPAFPPAFQWLFAADMVSLFGSLISRTALPFVAILFLNARPFEVALLSVADIVAGFASALLLGAVIDRWPRRRVMLVADVARAVLLLAIPLGAFMGWLSVPLLLVIALACGVFNVAFELAYAALLPRLLAQDQLLAGNSRMAAGQAVVETASFGIGGWLVQWLGAPIAVLVDALPLRTRARCGAKRARACACCGATLCCARSRRWSFAWPVAGTGSARCS
jgi:MFS family permease